MFSTSQEIVEMVECIFLLRTKLKPRTKEVHVRKGGNTKEINLAKPISVTCRKTRREFSKHNLLSVTCMFIKRSFHESRFASFLPLMGNLNQY